MHQLSYRPGAPRCMRAYRWDQSSRKSASALPRLYVPNVTKIEPSERIMMQCEAVCEIAKLVNISPASL